MNRTLFTVLRRTKAFYQPVQKNFFSVNRSVVCDKPATTSVNIFFVDREGEKRSANAKIGSNLLDVAIDNNVDLEGFGACEGTLSCSTCHLILDEKNYSTLKAPSDEENDMLDLAFGLTKTSRLGCQIQVTEKMKDWVFVVPKEVNDARS